MSAPKLRYFDNAATSFPKPPGVADAIARYLRESGAPARGSHAPAREAARLVNQCRQRIAKLVNCPSPDHVVFGYNTTDALNLAIKGVLAHARRRAGPSKELHVVTTVMEHNSVLRPMNAAMEIDGALKWTRVDANPATGLVDPEDVRRAIRPGQTVFVGVNHASNVTGVIQDVGAIGRVCSEFGAGKSGDGVLLLVDAAQSLGHIPVDMRAAHCDLLAFPGHKGLMGPTGTGGLVLRPGVEARLDTTREGGTGSSSEHPTHPTNLPDKYEAGSHNTVGIIGLGEGVAWLLERGIDAVRRHEVGLMQRLLDSLSPDARGRCAAAPGLTLLGPADPAKRVGVFSFTHDDLSPQELSAILEADYGILTRAGLHCAPLVHEMLGTGPAGANAGAGATRLSLGPFLTPDDIDAAAGALRAICAAPVPYDPACRT